MKKLTSLLLSLAMLFSLTACGGEGGELVDVMLDAAIDAAIEYGTNEVGVIGGADGPTSILVGEPVDEFQPSDAEEIGVIGGSETTTYIATENILPTEGEYYYDLESVVLYLDCYGELPDNYITKKEARALGWAGGNPEEYLEGSAIGGDRFGNREGLLPDGNYTECDLNTLGADSRGAERLVFSDDGEYYYTADHYESFTQVWVDDEEVIWE